MSAQVACTPRGLSNGAAIEGVRVLTFTSLFPSLARPRHGIFVETRLGHLVRDAGIDARVIAPVPWFPFRSSRFGAYSRYAATPRRAVRDGGLQVSYPRYLMLPRLGVPFQPENMARAAAADIAALGAGGWRPDIIDAHYLYPDGVAAALLAERLGLPFVVTARGTDVNVLGHIPGSAQRILWAAQRAAAVITVSQSLKRGLTELGADAAKIVVLRNGVDIDLFFPEEQPVARARLGLPAGRLAACVGNLVPEKGFSLAVESLARLPDWHLAVVGDGPLRAELAALARRLGVEARVIFLSSMPQEELRFLYSAADVLLLTSTREGWPNVVLESMACGTPVAAFNVGAVAEMLTIAESGRIVTQRDAASLSLAVSALYALAPSRERVRQHAARFDWSSVSKGQMDVFARALGQPGGVRRAGQPGAMGAD